MRTKRNVRTNKHLRPDRPTFSDKQIFYRQKKTFYGHPNFLRTKNVLRTNKHFLVKKNTFHLQSGQKTFILQSNYTCKQAINDQKTIYRRLVVTQT